MRTIAEMPKDLSLLTDVERWHFFNYKFSEDVFEVSLNLSRQGIGKDGSSLLIAEWLDEQTHMVCKIIEDSTEEQIEPQRQEAS